MVFDRDERFGRVSLKGLMLPKTLAAAFVSLASEAVGPFMNSGMPTKPCSSKESLTTPGLLADVLALLSVRTFDVLA